MSLLSLLFAFQGRINRRQYWLGSMGVGVGGAFVFFSLGLIFGPGAGSPSEASVVILLLSSLVFFLMGWSGLALQAKRFHDRGRSGYFALAPFVPWVMIATAVIGGVAADAPAQQVVPSILPWLGVLTLINIWFVVDLGALPGTDGPNKYDHTPSAPRGGESAPASKSGLGEAALAMERA
ncbi:MAG: DUF805 domain-containing protein, partial [Phycisphaerales bacterium]|nr:DUF805 domain-containing protein [Hyphomonadaceae bacterium]